MPNPFVSSDSFPWVLSSIVSLYPAGLWSNECHILEVAFYLLLHNNCDSLPPYSFIVVSNFYNKSIYYLFTCTFSASCGRKHILNPPCYLPAHLVQCILAGCFSPNVSSNLPNTWMKQRSRRMIKEGAVTKEQRFKEIKYYSQFQWWVVLV